MVKSDLCQVRRGANPQGVKSGGQSRDLPHYDGNPVHITSLFQRQPGAAGPELYEDSFVQIKLLYHFPLCSLVI